MFRTVYQGVWGGGGGVCREGLSYQAELDWYGFDWEECFLDFRCASQGVWCGDLLSAGLLSGRNYHVIWWGHQDHLSADTYQLDDQSLWPTGKAGQKRFYHDFNQ